MKSIVPVSPHTGSLMPEIKCTDLINISEIVAKSRIAQKKWKKIPFRIRCEVMCDFADELSRQKLEIADTISQEMGKILSEAKEEVEMAIQRIQTDIKFMEEAILPTHRHFNGGKAVTHWMPLGVAAVITPWNAPVLLSTELLVPSLLAGNSVLYKPSELTTKTGKTLYKALSKYLPNDVLQLVIGAAQQGQELVQSEIDFVAFVGSRMVGAEIYRNAASRNCRLLMELGGNDAMIVLPDADLEKTADFALRTSLSNAGQICFSVERIYVHQEIKSSFLRILLEKVTSVTVGDDIKGNICYGPMSSEKQLINVLNHIDDAVKKGATLHFGGKQIHSPGFHMEPTVISNLNDTMLMSQEETFGPVMALHSVSSVEEAIEKANNSRYGLTATVWTQDTTLAQQIALEMEVGLVGINGSYFGATGVPWAGAKASGLGHTGGVSGMRYFLQPRTVTIRS